MKSERERQDKGGRARKPYGPPRLSVHGDVEELTRVLRLGVTEGSKLSRELLGPDD